MSQGLNPLAPVAEIPNIGGPAATSTDAPVQHGAGEEGAERLGPDDGRRGASPQPEPDAAATPRVHGCGTPESTPSGWEMWEGPLLKKLRSEGDGLGDILAEPECARNDLFDEMHIIETAIVARHPQWEQYAPVVKASVLLLEYNRDKVQADWHSALHKTKCMALIARHEMRAHEQGLYILENGTWMQSAQMTTTVIESLEKACKIAAGLLLEDVAKLQEDFDKGLLSQALGTLAARPDAEERAAQALIRMQRVVTPRQRQADADEFGPWVFVAARGLLDWMPNWSSKVACITVCFCKWAFRPRPDTNGLIAFLDCVLSFQDGGAEQVRRSEAIDVYVKIPVTLATAPPDDFVAWFRKFFTTCIAGHEDGLNVECAIESLAMRGRVLPHHIVFYYGHGGNSKGARSSLRASTFADAHKWVSPGVFDVALRDEFRKQGTDFYGAMFCTLREADGFQLDEKVFKSWTAGEGLGCRLPHATHTPMLSWPKTGKFWEINVKSTPRIRSVTEAAFSRRIIGIEKKASFTSDSSKVDPANMVFEADGALEEKLTSGFAGWCYLRQVLLPWQRSNSEQQAREFIMRPGSRVRQDTRKLLEILKDNSSAKEAGNPAGSAVHEEQPFDRLARAGGSGQQLGDESTEAKVTADPTFIMLRKAHEAWETKSTVKDWLILQTPFIQGARWPGKKKTRVQYFEDALGSELNFFFDHAGDNDYVRAPYSSIGELLELPAEAFGTPGQWKPFRANDGVWARSSDGGSCDFEQIEAIRGDSAAEAAAGITILEVGDLGALKAYAALNVDRRPERLQQWIDRLESAGEAVGGGLRAVPVQYYQAHGIPGRYIAVGASLQNITKEARAVSVGDRCMDYDFPLSHATSLYRLVCEAGVSSDFPLLGKYVTHYGAWRQRWGKRALNVIMYMGVPPGDAWNPVTWTLAHEMKEAVERVLALPQFAYLLDMFGDRPKPFVTRMYYAITSHENARLMGVVDQLKPSVRGLMFDGFLLDADATAAADRADLDGAIVKPMCRWTDNLFMTIRSSHSAIMGAPTPIRKMERGKSMCIINALLNVAPKRTCKILTSQWTSSGPHTYGCVHRFLVASKTTQHLALADTSVLAAATPGCVVLIHCESHAVGAFVNSSGHWTVADDSYPTTTTLTADALRACVDGVVAKGKSVVVWELRTGSYTPSTLRKEFCLAAGHGDGGAHELVQVSADGRRTYHTPLTNCPKCQKKLYPDSAFDAVRRGFHEPEEVVVQGYRCATRGCKTSVTFNFYWDQGRKRNAVRLSDVKGEVLFLNNKTAFDVDFLQYHADLQFRAFTSMQAVGWTQRNVFGGEEDYNVLRKQMGAAVLLYRAIAEMERFDLQASVSVMRTGPGGGAVYDTVDFDGDALSVYESLLHAGEFQGEHAQTIKEVCIDGHEKVLMRTPCACGRRSGRPSERKSRKEFSNGWFMAVNPSDGRVLGVKAMLKPEDHAIKLEVLEAVLPSLPNADCLIYDRACGFKKWAKRHDTLKQLRFFAVDRFHARKHSSACTCSPKTNRRLARRLRGVNTSICEGTFAWFRNYSRLLNPCRPSAHKFLVLAFCRLHNQCVDARENGYVRPDGRGDGPGRSKHYPCSGVAATRKRPAAAGA